MNKQKKIALATWLGGPNYGTVLQSYALYKSIEELGCDVTVISRQDFIYGLKLKLGIRKQFPGSATAHKARQMQREELKTRSFITCRSYLSFCSRCNGFVCGSDQMWNTHYNFNPDFFLARIPGNKKIAYAPSLGTSDFKPSAKPKVKEYLKSFQSLSVREKTGCKAVAELTGRSDVKLVLDPVFLCSREGWTRFAAKSTAKNDAHDYVLCYLLRKDVDYKRITDEVRTHCDASEIILVQSFENQELSIPGSRRIDGAGPREFVSLIANAKFVVTDSFHGTAFSIIFHKPMLCLKRFDENDAQSQNSRITDLLGSLGLSDRLDGGNWKQPIDWKDVDTKLNDLRSDSIRYLKDALDNV